MVDKVTVLDIYSGYWYKYSMTVMNKSDVAAFTPQSCKETFQRYFAESYIFDQNIAIYGSIEGSIARQRPPLVMFGSGENYDATRAKQAEYTLEVLKCLKKDLHLRKSPRVGLAKSGSAIVFTVDRWLLAHPINVHFLMTMVRMGMCAAEMGLVPPMNSLRELIDWGISHRSALHQPDGIHLRDARENGNLDGILNKTLPCYAKEGFDSWHKARSDKTHYWLPGISMYNPVVETHPTEGSFPIDKLKNLYPPVKVLKKITAILS